MPVDQPVHLLRRFEVAIGVPLTPFAQRIDGDVVTDTGDDVLKDAAVGRVEQHVVGDDGRHPHPGREVGQFVQTELVVRPAAQRQCHIGPVAKGLAQPPQAQAASVVGVVRQENGK